MSSIIVPKLVLFIPAWCASPPKPTPAQPPMARWWTEEPYRSQMAKERERLAAQRAQEAREKLLREKRAERIERRDTRAAFMEDEPREPSYSTRLSTGFRMRAGGAF